MSSLFRPPAAARAATTLDRSLFHRTLPSTAAVVRDNKLLSRYRKDLEHTRDLLNIEKFRPIASHPDPVLAGQGQKCLILDPSIKLSSRLLLCTLASGGLRWHVTNFWTKVLSLGARR